MQQYGWRKAVLLSDTNASQPVCSYGATSINNWFMNPDGATVANYSIFYIAMADEPKADDIDSYLETISQQSRGETIIDDSHKYIHQRKLLETDQTRIYNGRLRTSS
jgi:hypothetical protein